MHYFEAIPVSASVLCFIGIPLGSAIGMKGAVRSALLSAILGQVIMFTVLTFLGHPLQEVTRSILQVAALGWFLVAAIICKRLLHLQ